MLFNVKGILQGWLMLALTLSRLVVEWALGRPRCELKHNGEGVTSLSSRLCGMKHNARAGELAFASIMHEVSGGCPCKRKLPCLYVCKNDPSGGCSCKSEGGRAGVSRSSPQGGQARARATVGWSVSQERAPQVVVL